MQQGGNREKEMCKLRRITNRGTGWEADGSLAFHSESAVRGERRTNLPLFTYIYSRPSPSPRPLVSTRPCTNPFLTSVVSGEVWQSKLEALSGVLWEKVPTWVSIVAGRRVHKQAGIAASQPRFSWKDKHTHTGKHGTHSCLLGVPLSSWQIYVSFSSLTSFLLFLFPSRTFACFFSFFLFVFYLACYIF